MTSESDIQPSKTRIPESIVWIGGWFIFIAGLLFFVTFTSSNTLMKLFSGAGGILYLVVALGLFKLKNWARWLGIIMFSMLIAKHVYQGFHRLTIFNIGYTLYAVWGVYYLTLSSTKSIFCSHRESKVYWLDVYVYAIELVAFIGTLFLFLLMKPWLPLWLIFTLALICFLIGVSFYDKKLRNWLNSKLITKPSHLSSDDWTCFNTIQKLKNEHAYEEAYQLALQLKDHSLHSLLTVILKMHLPRFQAPYHFIYNDIYETEDYNEDEMQAFLLAADLNELFHEWQNFYQACNDELNQLDSVIREELLTSLNDYTSTIIYNEEYQFQEWWHRKRAAIQTADDFCGYLAHRLWHTEMDDTAEKLAAQASDELLLETARLINFLEDFDQHELDQLPEEDLVKYGLMIPALCEDAGFIYVDSFFNSVFDSEVMAKYFTLRFRLIDWLIEFRNIHKALTGYKESRALKLLAAYDGTYFKTHAGFIKWWQNHKEQTTLKADLILTCYRQINEEKISKNAAIFEEAYQKRPDCTVFAYNAGYYNMQRENYPDACHFFQQVLEHKKEDSHALLNLANSYRLMGEPVQALAVYQKMLKSKLIDGSNIGDVGLTLSEAGLNQQAKDLFDSVLGEHPDAETLDHLADFLSQNKAHLLSYEYRQKAYQEKLSLAAEVLET